MIRHTIISYSCVYIYIVIIVTWILGISVTHAYMASLSSCHMDHCAYTCIIVPCYPIWLFPVTDMDIPDTGHESCWYAICGIPHLLFPFPLYCSRYIVPVILFPFPVILFYAINRAQVQLTCYRIMYCICSCYIEYLTYQIIKLTWVWGRLDGWLDLIGWCTGSILLVPLQGTVVLPTNSSMSSRYSIRAPLLAKGPGLSSQGFV